MLGDRNEINFNDAADLKYCSCIFKEALRLHPAVPTLSRVTMEEMVIADKTIPANTTILVIN